MKFKWKHCTNIFSLVIFTFFFCEYLIYYIVINQCSWPKLQDEDKDFTIKSIFLADTHLLGPFRGHWFDKLRREWQMYRSFQSAVTLYQPEVVFILGDLFDEGQWCNYKAFQDYIVRFFSLFRVPKNTQLYVVPGNHDVGFHYRLSPHLLKQFSHNFNSSSVQFLSLKASYFILINSMAMEGDYCSLCSEADNKLRKFAEHLKCIKDENCVNKNSLEKYSRPIVLQHFPMFRKSDSDCNEPDEAPPHIKNNLFQEKWDCLSKEASELIYNELNPRAIFTGHVHHGCHIVHREDIHEYTLPSFSWRNKNNPTFILAKFTPNEYKIRKCNLPKETTVIFIYILAILGSLVMLFSKVIKSMISHLISKNANNSTRKFSRN